MPKGREIRLIASLHGITTRSDEVGPGRENISYFGKRFGNRDVFRLVSLWYRGPATNAYQWGAFGCEILKGLNDMHCDVGSSRVVTRNRLAWFLSDDFSLLRMSKYCELGAKPRNPNGGLVTEAPVTTNLLLSLIAPESSSWFKSVPPTILQLLIAGVLTVIICSSSFPKTLTIWIYCLLAFGKAN